MNGTERVMAYVDGFNLYFGIRQHGRRLLWLDLDKLVRSLLKPHQRLEGVRYFTASVRNDPPSEHRQRTYLRALEAHCPALDIVLGRFQQKTKTCKTCRSSWPDYEEKETDVSLAVSLLEDGVSGRYDTALIISADSDMCPAIRSVKRLLPSVRVIAVFPPNRRSHDLMRACDATLPLGLAKVRQSQLPESITVAGTTLKRPDHWK
ncbi:NYN domain-containing protein [Sphaerisporangium viridialbum]|uniref:NYN domain-containing protein n=1 Tax=Sphaerisporangium viridialbum TaxID=46189 RepID=UPI003C754513